MITSQLPDSDVVQFPGSSQIRSSRAEERVNSYPSQGKTITNRLKVLDAEWDIDRVLATTGVGLSVALLWCAPRRSGRWVALGVALPLLAFRCAAMGRNRKGLLKLLRLRTRAEIDAEKFALRVIRGDFDGIDDELHRRACAMNALRSMS